MVHRASARGQQWGQLRLRPAGMLAGGVEHVPQRSQLQHRSSDTYPSSPSLLRATPRAISPWHSWPAPGQGSGESCRQAVIGVDSHQHECCGGWGDAQVLAMPASVAHHLSVPFEPGQMVPSGLLSHC